jgi:geranylgeranyl pyrophosphate synthase
MWNDGVRQNNGNCLWSSRGKLENIVPLQVALSFIDATMDIHDDIIDDSMKKRNQNNVR